MPKYMVTLTKNTTSTGEVSVSAKDEESAEVKALDLAEKDKVDWNFDDADYEVDSVEEDE